MKKNVLFFALSCVLLTGCNYSRSFRKDFLSGITSTGNNLSCEDIYVSLNDSRKTGNTFIYGETFFVKFDNVSGLVQKEGKVYPELRMWVVSVAGDTVFRTDDLMAEYSDGFSSLPLEMSANLTVADPIKSGADYRAIIKITDKNGDGILTAEYPFKVVKNENIKIETEGISFNEVYLFSEGKERVISDNRINFNDNIHIIIEGIEGFQQINGMVFPGLSIKATDAGGNIILDNNDIFSGYAETGVEKEAFARRVSAHFRIPETSISNPLKCQLVLWDRKSRSKMIVSTEMVIVKP